MPDRHGTWIFCISDKNIPKNRFSFFPSRLPLLSIVLVLRRGGIEKTPFL